MVMSPGQGTPGHARSCSIKLRGGHHHIQAALTHQSRSAALLSSLLGSNKPVFELKYSLPKTGWMTRDGIDTTVIPSSALFYDQHLFGWYLLAG